MTTTVPAQSPGALAARSPLRQTAAHIADAGSDFDEKRVLYGAFDLLWAGPRFEHSAPAMRLSGKRLALPPTLLFKQNIPVAFYLMGPRGVVQRLGPGNIDLRAAYKVFARFNRRHRCDIAGVFMSEERVSGSAAIRTNHEYLDLPTVRTYLLSAASSRPRDGALQLVRARSGHASALSPARQRRNPVRPVARGSNNDASRAVGAAPHDAGDARLPRFHERCQGERTRACAFEARGSAHAVGCAEIDGAAGGHV